MIDGQANALKSMLSGLGAPPVLVDVGASGEPPAIWSDIAEVSIYVGFDPDLREMHELPTSGFRRAIIINKAITDQVEKDNVEFLLTRSPYCSSTLQPDTKSLENYIFSDLFIVDSKTEVGAITLDKVLETTKLERIDWLKTDTQGTDLRLYTSLSDKLKSTVLAVDVEPGLIDAYEKEDLFIDAHKTLTASGFWLSALDVKGTIRIKKSTREALTQFAPELNDDFLESNVRRSPGWCEARYLRTIESIAASGATEREHVLLWIFAMLDGQSGFALDVAVDFKERFTGSALRCKLFEQTIASLKEASREQSPTHDSPSCSDAGGGERISLMQRVRARLLGGD